MPQHYAIRKVSASTSQESIESTINKMHEDAYRIVHTLVSGDDVIFVFEYFGKPLFDKLFPGKIITSPYVPPDKVFLVNPGNPLHTDFGGQGLDVKKAGSIWGLDLGSEKSAWSTEGEKFNPASFLGTFTEKVADDLIDSLALAPKQVKVPYYPFNAPTNMKLPQTELDKTFNRLAAKTPKNPPLNEFGYEKKDRLPLINERVIIEWDKRNYFGKLLRMIGKTNKMEIILADNSTRVLVFPSNIVAIRNT